jgi:outer membrane protein assembly factor BamB
MLALTGLVFTAVVLGHILINDLNDLAGIGLDVVTVGSVAALALLLLAWEVWLLFLSGWKWRYRVLGGSALAALPILFLSVFRPVNGGDANLMRFEPIWTSRPEPPTTTSASDAGGADLQSTSPGDYPQFLGQQQNGVIASGRRIDVSKFSESRMVWKQPIGQGWSGFAARNGFAVTMEQRGDQECVTCYEIATGRLVWMHQHPGRHRDAMNLGRVGPRSTPTIHDGNVYAVGAVGRFVCLAGATGKVIWEADLNALLGIELQSEVDSDDLAFQYEKNTSLSWGRAGSPLIVDDLVIVPGGGPEGRNRATLLAFDRLSGVLRWRNGDEMIAYGTPVLATVAGVRQVLLVTETKAMGFDPADGRTLWEQSRPGQSNGAANTSQLSLVAENRILTSKGYPEFRPRSGPTHPPACRLARGAVDLVSRNAPASGSSYQNAEKTTRGLAPGGSRID